MYVFSPPPRSGENSRVGLRPAVCLSVRPSVRPSVPEICPGHIYHTIRGRVIIFGMWVDVWIAECHAPKVGHCDPKVGHCDLVVT